jgi:hypothetical protein
MICDLCNAAIIDKPACLLGTKEVVTSKHCWTIYLKSLIVDKVMPLHVVQESLSDIVGCMASSDMPWALCDACKQSLTNSGLTLHFKASDLPSHGHALCRQSKATQFEAIDDEGIQAAFKAANSAALEIMAKN